MEWRVNIMTAGLIYDVTRKAVTIIVTSNNLLCVMCILLPYSNDPLKQTQEAGTTHHPLYSSCNNNGLLLYVPRIADLFLVYSVAQEPR